MRKMKNRFAVHVVFPDHAFGIDSRKDVEITPEDVLRELQDICERIEKELQRQR